MKGSLYAGASAIDITPPDSQFLYGYPHVERYSTGVHDPLYCSALYLSDGRTKLLFLTNDLIFISKNFSRNVRLDIQEAIGVPPENTLITATHTHSGPITVNYISNESDVVIPKADEKYLSLLERCVLDAAVQAYRRVEPVRVGFALADSTGIGTNRHDPSGPADFEVPVLLVKSLATNANIATMIVCSMHPTVLHEDSTLISADFPGMTRSYLQKRLLGEECPVLYHTGPAGNQSPRYVTTANTFSEARRLGEILAESIIQSVSQIEYISDISLNCRQKEIDLPRNEFPATDTARFNLEMAKKRLTQLQAQQALKQQIRTAECDWFGAEEKLSLTKAAIEGRLEKFYQSCLPAEIQVFKMGPWTFIGWPGEIFVEYGLAIKKLFRDTFVISLANGELQGYIVTAEASAAGVYEASNALFSNKSGQILVNESAKIIEQMR